MEDKIICKSQAMKAVLEKAAQVAPARIAILLMGETGVGKTLLARYIHHASLEKDGPFVDLDAGVIPSSLRESELFGHEKGAFTGAMQTKTGLIEQANGGTLFIDEIQNLSMEVQTKLLRVLDNGKFRRIGGREDLHSYFRLITATNEDLLPLMSLGKFRRDLYFRLASTTIIVPPLRDRREDILPMAEHCLQIFSHASGKTMCLSDETKVMLFHYSWPGNIRELNNVVQNAALLCRSAQLHPDDFALQLQCEDLLSNTDKEGASLEEMEQRYIAMILRRTNGNLTEASRILKIGYSTLLRKVKKLGLKKLFKNGRMS